MKRRHVSEPAPVQAYLTRDDYALLDRLVGQLGTSKSDVIRRGIHAVERELADPARHPALRLIGLAERELKGVAEVDVAREHDTYLAGSEEKSWRKPKSGRCRRGS